MKTRWERRRGGRRDGRDDSDNSREGDYRRAMGFRSFWRWEKRLHITLTWMKNLAWLNVNHVATGYVNVDTTKVM